MLETDFPAGEEVHQNTEASPDDGASLAGSVASVGSVGSDGTMASEGTTAIPQTASSGLSEQGVERGSISVSGIRTLTPDMIVSDDLSSLKMVIKLLFNPEWKIVGCLTQSDILGSLAEVSREASPTEDGVPPAEEATEATEANAGVGDEEEEQGVDPNQPGIYTEHVFTDPLGMEPSDPSQSDSKYLFFINFTHLQQRPRHQP